MRALRSLVSIRSHVGAWGAWLFALPLGVALGCSDPAPELEPPGSGGAGASGAGGAGAGGIGGAGAGGSGGAGAGGIGGAAGAAGASGAPARCEVPTAPVLEYLHAGATLAFHASGPVEVGTSLDRAAREPERWERRSSVTLAESATASAVKVFARLAEPTCEPAGWFEHVYELRQSYDGPAGVAGSLALDKASPRIVGWATGFVSPVQYGADVDAAWRTPERALGPAVGTSFDILCLGNGGRATLRFEPPITDGPGGDFAVFENAFNDTFLELGFVEVSSDGEHFARFSSAYLGDASRAGSQVQQADFSAGLAGKYRQGYGVVFDLALLRYAPEVQAGRVDLRAITHVRIVDIIGDGSVEDSFGHPIYDPTPTTGSGGFDLDAIAVLHAAP